MTKQKQPKLDRDSDAWQREANRLARDYVIVIQCMKCSYPVVDGYCCTYCGDSNPQSTQEQDDERNARYEEKRKKIV